MDNELSVLNSVGLNTELTQRDIAKQTGLSLGTINILLKKMIREGLIKLETIPSDRLAYMLTPKGMDEKARKVGTYIQHHYKAIECMRIQLSEVLDPLIANDNHLLLDIKQVELLSIVKQILQEKGIGYVVASKGDGHSSKTIISDYNQPAELADEVKWINIVNEIIVGKGI